MAKELLSITQHSANKARIEIDGTIGGFDWDTWTEKNTGSDIRKQLKKLSALDVEEIEVLITSLGGRVDDALQIHDALRSHPAKVTTIVQGFCASAATVIACAGDERIISPNALYLIHKCMSSVWNANENALESELDDQRTINETILNIYKRVLKKDEADLQALFESNNGYGKWITAEDALDFGFATKIQEFDNDNKRQATTIARFLNNARSVFPDMNSYHQKTTEMKKILISFAMLGSLLDFKEDAEYDEKEGLRLTSEQLQTVEDTLKAFDNLKAKASQIESDLQGAKDALSTAEQSIADKDTLIATITAERDTYKAKYENAPANVSGVNGKDVKIDESFDSYIENDEYYKQIQAAIDIV